MEARGSNAGQEMNDSLMASTEATVDIIHAFVYLLHSRHTLCKRLPVYVYFWQWLGVHDKICKTNGMLIFC